MSIEDSAINPPESNMNGLPTMDNADHHPITCLHFDVLVSCFIMFLFELTVATVGILFVKMTWRLTKRMERKLIEITKESKELLKTYSKVKDEDSKEIQYIRDELDESTETKHEYRGSLRQRIVQALQDNE